MDKKFLLGNSNNTWLLLNFSDNTNCKTVSSYKLLLQSVIVWNEMFCTDCILLCHSLFPTLQLNNLAIYETKLEKSINGYSNLLWVPVVRLVPAR